MSSSIESLNAAELRAAYASVDARRPRLIHSIWRHRCLDMAPESDEVLSIEPDREPIGAVSHWTDILLADLTD